MESQKGEREDDDLKDLTSSAAKLDVATDDILIDGEEGEEDEMSQEEQNSLADNLLGPSDMDTSLPPNTVAEDLSGSRGNPTATEVDSQQSNWSVQNPHSFGYTDIRSRGHVPKHRAVSKYNKKHFPQEVPKVVTSTGTSGARAKEGEIFNRSHANQVEPMPQIETETEKEKTIGMTGQEEDDANDVAKADAANDLDNNNCPFQVVTVESSNESSRGPEGEKHGGSRRCGGGEGSKNLLPQSDSSDSTNSDDSDGTLVGFPTAEPGRKIESSAPRPPKPKTAAQREAVARRRANRRARDKVIILASKGGPPPPPPPPPPQAEKRRSLEEPSASSTKPAKRQCSSAVSDYLDNVVNVNPNPGDDLVNRHGPLSISTLNLFAREMHGGRNEVVWEGHGHPNPRIQPNSPHGLRLHQIGPDGNIVPSDAEAANAARRGQSKSDSLWVHSSRLIEQMRKIDSNGATTCSTCQQVHRSTPVRLNLLLCSSEAVASAGLSEILTSSGMPSAALPSFGDCFEVLWIPGGLEMFPKDVMQRVYGSCQLPLNIILNMGGEAVMSGESARTVFSELLNLREWLERDFRKGRRVTSKVFLASPLQWKGEGHLHLSMPPKEPLSFSQRSELHTLAVSIETMNNSLVSHSSYLARTLPRWCEHVGHRREVTVSGNSGRTRIMVEPVAKPSVSADAEGDLHLDKRSLLSLVRETFRFLRRR